MHLLVGKCIKLYKESKIVKKVKFYELNKWVKYFA